MKILFCGESWVKHIIHTKGFDSFTNTEYEEGIQWFAEAMKVAGIEMDFLPGHLTPDHFPVKLEELQAYDAVFLSDIGSNSLLLSNQTFAKSEVAVNRLDLIKQYVEQGGGFAMIGGYLTFQGIDAKARYKDTSVEDILPVTMMPYDDRYEAPEGLHVQINNSDHPIFKGIDEEWPHFLGYNKVYGDEDAEVLAEHNKYAFIAVKEVGKGRTFSFASDLAPHWGPPEFINWKHYNTFWGNVVKWLSGE
ncbi:glutamine amidotransferase [Salipaludibacillus daqingensis]|uniref:glutamine amidotransferase n=1 Tax=Salipaludibacillus daqingensis TaxID=3041001 RepID=UPI002474C04E|nr:glutamine amidotransferase [Salipaludibacillus daqingensis]